MICLHKSPFNRVQYKEPPDVPEAEIVQKEVEKQLATALPQDVKKTIEEAFDELGEGRLYEAKAFKKLGALVTKVPARQYMTLLQFGTTPPCRINLPPSLADPQQPTTTRAPTRSAPSTRDAAERLS